MGFVKRDQNGKINGYASLGSSDMTERIADDDPELLAFLNPPTPPRSKPDQDDVVDGIADLLIVKAIIADRDELRTAINAVLTQRGGQP